jgi:hypothetical protein
MGPERAAVVGPVVAAFVVVRHLNVAVDKQAVRDEQVVRLVSNRRELLLVADGKSGDERERACGARGGPCVEDEANQASVAVTQQMGQRTQGDGNPCKTDDRTGPYEKYVRNR